MSACSPGSDPSGNNPHPFCRWNRGFCRRSSFALPSGASVARALVGTGSTTGADPRARLVTGGGRGGPGRGEADAERPASPTTTNPIAEWLRRETSSTLRSDGATTSLALASRLPPPSFLSDSRYPDSLDTAPRARAALRPQGKTGVARLDHVLDAGGRRESARNCRAGKPASAQDPARVA